MIKGFLPAILFTLLTYSTLGVVPELWKQINTVLPASQVRWMFQGLLALAFAFLLIYLFAMKKASWSRIFWLIGIALGCGGFLSTIDNVVERVHLLQYGVLAVLYYLALANIFQDRSVFIVTWLVVFAVGVGDELLQFLLPQRVGSLSDIYLNGASAVFGLILVATVFPSLAPQGRVSGKNLGRTCWVAIIVLLFSAGFCEGVTDYGYFHRMEGVGGFYSRFDLDELQRKDHEAETYGERIRDLYPVKMHAYLKRQGAIDKYLMEVLVHVFRRDRYVKIENYWVALMENAILERHFQNNVAAAGLSWNKSKIRRLQSRMRSPENNYYESPVSRDDIIVLFGPRTFWAVVLGVAGVLLFVRHRWATEL